MTSRSLRKHQITPWSLLQRIDSESASVGLARWLRHAGVAGLAIISLASGTLAADESGRARISPEVPESADSVSGKARLATDAPQVSDSVSGKARLATDAPQASDSVSGKAQLDSDSQEKTTDVSGVTRFVSEGPGSPARVAGRARLDSAEAKSPASSAGTAKQPQKGWARSKNRVSVSPATQSRILPPNELPPENLFPSTSTTHSAVRAAGGTLADSDESGSEVPGSDLPVEDVAAAMPQDVTELNAAAAMQNNAAVDETAIGTHYSGEVQETFERAHRRRMDYVMNGRSPGSISSVGEWWHEHSEQYVCNNRHLAVVSGQWWHEHSQNYAVRNRHLVDASRNSLQQYMIEHTLPEYTVPEVDFYDSNPIALSSPSTQPPIEEEEPVENGELTGTSRLKTDIRTIKPTLSYALKGIDRNELPDDFYEPIDNGQYVARQTSPTVLQWAPTNLWHYPLYFEDPSLERYGHSHHPLVQPFASTGRFATQLVGLPYQMTLHPVHSKEYALGYYRPGECAPKKCYQIPFNEEATLMEVAMIAGLILIFP